MIRVGARTILIAILTLLISSECCAQQLGASEQREKILTPKVFQNAKGESLPYRLFIPQNYDAKKKYPLVVYLHGSGGLGTDNLKQIQTGNVYMIDLFTAADPQSRYPAFVVAPQSSGEGWIHQDFTPTRQLQLVAELVGELRRVYSIDKNRAYVAGQSMGGFGTYAMIAAYPNLFAAAVPLCGGGDEAQAAQMMKTPIWAFHGDKDDSVPVEYSRKIVAAINKAGGKAKYTEYPGEGHNIWQKVVKEPELLPWLFAQHR